MSKIPFKNKIDCCIPEPKPIECCEVDISVLAEIKLWCKKYVHLEDCKVGKGDNIGFILTFSNDGEITSPADPKCPSVEDTLVINCPICLKLISLCLCDEYELWVVDDSSHNPCDYKVEPCQTFSKGEYKLQLRKKVRENKPAIPYFDIPCNYICCISMLFQIEFPCDECPCLSNQMKNESSDNGLDD